MTGKVVKPRKAARANVRALIQEAESLDLSEPQNMARAQVIVLELFAAAIAGNLTALSWILQICDDEERE